MNEGNGDGRLWPLLGKRMLGVPVHTGNRSLSPAAQRAVILRAAEKRERRRRRKQGGA